MLLSPLEQFYVISLHSFDISLFSNKVFLLVSNFELMFLILIGLFFFFYTITISQKTKIFSSNTILFSYFYNFIQVILRENILVFRGFFFNYIFILFSFLLLANLLGMVPYSFAITSHFAITLFLSALTFFLAVFVGVQQHGLRFFDLFLPPGAPFVLAPFLILIELISYIARLFSLAIRLFANIMSGHTLLKILSGFSWTLSTSNYFILALFPFLVVFVITGLEIVISMLQAYVFTVLSSIYINEGIFLH